MTVTIGGHAGTDLGLDATRLAFDENNWNTPWTVTVTAGQTVIGVRVGLRW